MTRFVLLALLSACSDPEPADTDTVPDTTDTTDTWSGGKDTSDCEPNVSDAAGWAVVDSATAEPSKTIDTANPSSLEATSPGPGLVSVQHTGVPDEFCYGFCMSAAWTAAGDLAPFYSFGSEAGPDTVGCTWDIQYQLSGVPSGAWTLSSRGDSVVVVVE